MNVEIKDIKGKKDLQIGDIIVWRQPDFGTTDVYMIFDLPMSNDIVMLNLETSRRFTSPRGTISELQRHLENHLESDNFYVYSKDEFNLVLESK